MSRRQSPSKQTNRSHAYTGPPRDKLKPLRDGQVRCPSCMAPVSVNPSGKTRKHRTPHGDDCPYRAGTRQVHLEELPPVVGAATRRTATPPRMAKPPDEPSRLDVGSHCQDCGKWLPGERSLCGQCYLKHEANRKRPY